MISKQEQENFGRVFQAFDLDGDQLLSREEIRLGYIQFYKKKLTEKELDDIFKQMDTDQSGFIDYNEFVSASIDKEIVTQNEKLMEAFKMFDKDNNGAISPQEIKDVLGFGGNYSEKEIDQLIKEADQNDDGEISFDEFVVMMQSLTRTL